MLIIPASSVNFLNFIPSEITIIDVIYKIKLLPRSIKGKIGTEVAPLDWDPIRLCKDNELFIIPSKIIWYIWYKSIWNPSIDIAGISKLTSIIVNETNTKSLDVGFVTGTFAVYPYLYFISESLFIPPSFFIKFLSLISVLTFSLYSILFFY